MLLTNTLIEYYSFFLLFVYMIANLKLELRRHYFV